MVVVVVVAGVTGGPQFLCCLQLPSSGTSCKPSPAAVACATPCSLVPCCTVRLNRCTVRWDTVSRRIVTELHTYTFPPHRLPILPTTIPTSCLSLLRWRQRPPSLIFFPSLPLEDSWTNSLGPGYNPEAFSAHFLLPTTRTGT